MSDSQDASISISAGTVHPSALDVDAIVLPVFGAEDALAELGGLDEVTGGEWSRARGAGEFRAKLYEAFVTRVTGGGWKAKRLVLLGAGQPADADAVRIRRLAAAASHLARTLAIDSAAFVIRGLPDPVAAARGVADGLHAALFDVGGYKRSDPPRAWRWKTVQVVVPGAVDDDVTRAVRHGAVIGGAVNVTRALVNEPGNVLPPAEFAARVERTLSGAGLDVEVLDESRMAELGMHLLLGVARGSAQPPRLVVARYDPPGAESDRVVGLVGKGVTFDSGGISLKPALDMDRMKSDMAGGAAVTGAMLAIARLRGPHRVVGVIPMVENMPGGRAIRPGDVLEGASGKTVEITNTDAEGRLILADALWYARRLGATHVLDVATLTGACVVALGHSTSGLFGSDRGWIDTLRALADRAGERVWPMPIYEEAIDQLRSQIADLVNAGGRVGGAVTAAAFLREFAGDGPWAHLDIAGTAWAEKRTAYEVKGPTGAAVRLLTELALTAGRLDRA